MKKVLATIAEWFAIVGVLGALVGFIFPPAGKWHLDEKGAKDWDWLTFGKLFSSDGSALVVVAMIVLVLALVATFYFAVVSKVAGKPVTGFVLLGTVLVGFLCALFVRNTLIVNPTNHVYVGSLEDMKDSLGVYIMAVAYLLQIVGAVVAVAASFMQATPAEKAE